MAVTWLAGVIGLSTETMMFTLLPFSTNGATSSVTLPVCNLALPTKALMADWSSSGAANSGRAMTEAARAAVDFRRWRRVEVLALGMVVAYKFVNPA